MTRNITAHFIRTYLKNAEEAENTSGNVIHSVEYGTSIGGGWEPYFNADIARKGALMAASGLTLMGLFVHKQK